VNNDSSQNTALNYLPHLLVRHSRTLVVVNKLITVEGTPSYHIRQFFRLTRSKSANRKNPPIRQPSAVPLAQQASHLPSKAPPHDLNDRHLFGPHPAFRPIPPRMETSTSSSSLFPPSKNSHVIDGRWLRPWLRLTLAPRMR